jgi:hypothetical protein
MPRSDIPVDVLRDILDHVDKASLATMCRVNKICCSQDVLYRDIFVTHSSSKVHRTLAQSTHLARRVRSFDSNYEDTYLAIALRNMTSLRDLKLLGPFYDNILDGCTFKLDSFECKYLGDFGESFPKFLSSQPSLKYMTLPVDIDDPESSPLETTCLPNLTRINATLSWLAYLIPGRPLNEVITSAIALYGDPSDLSFFALSTTPIQKLTIEYNSLGLVPRQILAFLPSLTHFTLTVWKNYTFFKNEGVCGLPLY